MDYSTRIRRLAPVQKVLINYQYLHNVHFESKMPNIKAVNGLIDVITTL